MKEFGKLLRFYRERCTDPETGKKLTQERLGELLGYTPQLVSLWEKEKSRIPDRSVLINAIKIFCNYGGIQSQSEANALLLAADYRPLAEEERQQVFPGSSADTEDTPPTSSPDTPQWEAESPLQKWFSRLREELNALLTKAAKGPSPQWPRKLAALFRWAADRLKATHVARAFFWFWVCVVTWVLTAPSLRWPFTDQEQVKNALILYVAGTLVSPLLIGGLTATKNDEFWLQQGLATARMTRLYTHQGAFLGFHLGYVALFIFALGGYNLSAGRGHELNPVGTILPVGLGYAGARLVPYNLWRACSQLRLSDGAIFFIFVVLGIFWSISFYSYHPVLLTPGIGLLVWGAAITILATTTAWYQRRTGSSLIPSHWWVRFWGIIFLLYQIAQATTLFRVVSSAGLIITLAVLLARGRAYISLSGGIGLLAGSGLLFICFRLNAWLGVTVAGVMLLVWLRWGRKFIWLSWEFWAVLLTVGGGTWIVRQLIATDLAVSIVFSLIVLLLLRRKK